MSIEKFGWSDVNGIFDNVLSGIDFSAVQNVLVTYLQGRQEFSKVEKNLLWQHDDESMKANIIVIFLKAILKRDFYKFCQFLKESKSKLAQTMGFKLLKEAKSLVRDEISGKNH